MKNLTLILFIFISLFLGYDYAFGAQNNDEARNVNGSMVIGGLTQAQAEDFSIRVQKAQEEFAPIMNHINRGKQFLKNFKFKESEEEFKAAIQISKGGVGRRLGRLGLADVYEKKGDYKKAIEILQVIRDEDAADFAKPEINSRIVALKEKERQK